MNIIHKHLTKVVVQVASMQWKEDTDCTHPACLPHIHPYHGPASWCADIRKTVAATSSDGCSRQTNDADSENQWSKKYILSVAVLSTCPTMSQAVTVDQKRK